MKKIKKKSIRVKLIIFFLISIFISIYCGLMVNSWIVNNENINGDKEFKTFNYKILRIIDNIKDSKSNSEIKNEIEENKNITNIFILDSSGKVKIKSDMRAEESFNLEYLNSKEKYYKIAQFEVEYNNLYKLNSGEYIYFNTILNKHDHTFIMLLTIIISFSILFFTFTHKELNYINELCRGLKEVSNGDLTYRARIYGSDEISEIAQSINYMTEKLYAAREEEKRIEKNKDEFIMNISHDLRTPLTSIIGYIKLVKSEHKKDDNIKKYIDIIDLKSEQLDKLINNFFEYNKLTIGKVKMEKVSVSLNEFLRQIVTGMLPLCVDKNLKIKLQLPKEELIYSLDPEKMLRAIENLISNAIKYCDINTDIIVSLKKGKDGFIILVENTCNSLKNIDNMDRLFERFYRADKSRNTSNGGAGLGLAISKSIVELHKGKIYSQCKDNKVSFKIVLNDD